MAARSPVLAGFGDDFSWSLLDAAPDTVLVIDHHGQIVFANAHGAQLFGATSDELLDRPVEDLLPGDLRAVHQAHRARYRAEPVVRTMGTGMLLRALRADGTEFPVEISLSPLHLGEQLFTVAAVRDVSDRVQAEDHLHRVLHTLDASDDGVFIFDAATLRYSYVNDGAVRLTGYPRDELLAMSPLHLNADAVEAEYRELVATLDAHPDHAVTRQAILLRKDGIEVPIEKTYQSAPLGHDGTEWIIALARDKTARLQTEEELRRSQDALRQAEQVMVVAEDRERIARDLHDTVIQRLFGAGLNLQATMAGADDRIRARLEATISDLDETIKELRTAIFSLQGPSSAAPGGLRGQIFAVISEASPLLGFEPRLQFDGPIETIRDPIADHLLPILREALANVAHHAHARHVRVTITVADTVALTVVDDGTGAPDEVFGGRGLTNMTNRATAMAGHFALTHEPAGGTRLTWQVPTHPAPVAAAAPGRNGSRA